MQWFGPCISALGRRQPVVGVEVPLAAPGLTVGHHQVEAAALPAVEVLHDHGALGFSPFGELRARGDEVVVVDEFNALAEQDLL